MRHIGWFLFNLLALGYVEDSNSEESFRMPKKCSWKLYIEVSVIVLQHYGQYY